MIFERILRSFPGTIEVELKGGYASKFVSELFASGAEIFDVETMANGSCRFRMRPQKYASLRPLARRYQCRMRVIRKEGLVFLLSRAKHIAESAAALAAFAGMVTALGFFVVSIDIVGADDVDRNMLKERLNSCGVSFMAPRSGIDVAGAENEIMLDFEELSWASLNVSYGSAVLEMAPKKDRPETKFDNTSGVATASENAIIKSIALTSGISLISPGEVVLKGQVIAVRDLRLNSYSWASGINGSVIGNVSVGFTKNYGIVEYDREATGRSISFLAPSIDDRTVYFISRVLGYDYYDLSSTHKQLSVFGVELPVSYVMVEISEVSQISYSMTFALAKEKFSAELNRFEKTISGRVLSRTVDSCAARGRFSFTADYIVQKNILSFE